MMMPKFDLNFMFMQKHAGTSKGILKTTIPYASTEIPIGTLFVRHELLPGVLTQKIRGSDRYSVEAWMSLMLREYGKPLFVIYSEFKLLEALKPLMKQAGDRPWQIFCMRIEGQRLQIFM